MDLAGKRPTAHVAGAAKGLWGPGLLQIKISACTEKWIEMSDPVLCDSLPDPQGQ